MKAKISKGEIVRNEIIETSIRLFASHGFLTTSFQMIGDECGMKQTAILRHYPNKNELLLAILERIVKRNHEFVSEISKPQDGALERLLKYYQGNIDWSKKCPEQAQIILLLYYYSTFNSDFSELYKKLLQAGRNRVIELLYSGAREGIFQFGNNNIEMIGQILHETLIGLIINIIATKGDLSKDNYKQAMNKVKYQISSLTKNQKISL